MSERCPHDETCITCGDVAVALTVVEADGCDAWCQDDGGRTERVAVDLVGPVAPGERVLAHAGVALARVEAASRPPGAAHLDGEGG